MRDTLYKYILPSKNYERQCPYLYADCRELSETHCINITQTFIIYERHIV